ncbi:SHOCT domain-containing protein [Hymenobacter negativus]|uniref:SHOCT domain-containing protein n=1 Tax=Hymenobacter negativus TaxID=2795026 RepID=A0ABS0Q5P8_9BACT|nr:SHOCT domain-containing protein [Hymenobacter negativus]MBH8557983.1 SHOCT domain-containing protein [Hymenobacter negativus]
MDNPNSPLDTLRQLKEMLDAGAITPTEFEALKQRLVFTAPAAPTAPSVPVAPEPAAPEPVAPPMPVGFNRPPMAPEPVLPLAEELPAPEPEPVSFTAGPEPMPEPEPAWRTRNEFPPMAEEPARNPLALVFAIGGVLAFLAVVLYLNLNRPPSEHISSTSQTAADSLALAAPVETGPQAEPLPATVATPETVRVAPAHPAPVIQPRATPTRSDSAATAPPTTISDSAARQ